MTKSDIPLGKSTAYPTAYDPALLYAVPRSSNRGELDITAEDLPFGGFDHWRAYELSWLLPSGRPVVALADILVPCESPYLIESKSMKLYFNSLNQHVFTDSASAGRQIQQDLAAVAGAPVSVILHASEASAMHTMNMTDGVLLDDLDVGTLAYQPDAELLHAQSGTAVEETLYSHLFRSNCPITAQPDWGSIVIRYQGAQIDHASLLAYLVSYRLHEGFHEHCVEQIFKDLTVKCRPQVLQVSINFLRRGGLEINPLRSSDRAVVAHPLGRLLRQ